MVGRVMMSEEVSRSCFVHAKLCLEACAGVRFVL